MPTANDAPTMAAATASLVANRGMAGSSTQDGSSLFSAHSQVKSSQVNQSPFVSLLISLSQVIHFYSSDFADPSDGPMVHAVGVCCTGGWLGSPVA
jgi:hypothetical protein